MMLEVVPVLTHCEMGVTRRPVASDFGFSSCLEVLLCRIAIQSLIRQSGCHSLAARVDRERRIAAGEEVEYRPAVDRLSPCPCLLTYTRFSLYPSAHCFSNRPFHRASSPACLTRIWMKVAWNILGLDCGVFGSLAKRNLRLDRPCTLFERAHLYMAGAEEVGICACRSSRQGIVGRADAT